MPVPKWQLLRQCSGTIPTIPTIATPTIPESTMFFGLWSRFKAPSPSAKSNARSIHFWMCLGVSSLNSISVRARETSHFHFSTKQMLRAHWHGFREIVGQIPRSNFDEYHQDPTFSKENILVRQCRRNRRTQSAYYSSAFMSKHADRCGPTAGSTVHLQEVLGFGWVHIYGLEEIQDHLRQASHQLSCTGQWPGGPLANMAKWPLSKTTQ